MFVPLPQLAFTVSSKWPRQRSQRIGYFNYQLSSALSVAVEGPASLPGTIGNNNGEWEASFNQSLAGDVEASMDVANIFELIDNADTGTPRRLGLTLLEGLGLTRKFGPVELELSYQAETPYCVFVANFTVLDRQYPQTGYWRFPASTVDCRLKLTGTFSIRFGPNERGWRAIGSRAGRAIRPLITQISQSLGRAAARPIVAGTGYVIAGIIGGLGVAALSAEITNRARRDGLNWALARQYAEGYMGILWIRVGTSFADGDFNRAVGTQHRWTDAYGARMLGVNHAIADVDHNGGGTAGMAAVRRALFGSLNLSYIDVSRPAPGHQEPAISALTDHIRRNQQVVRANAG